MKTRYAVAAAMGILLAGASPAAAQRASIQATATVIAPVEAPTVSVVGSTVGGEGLTSLVVAVERDWVVTVQVGDEPAVVYAEPWVLRDLEVAAELPVRVTVAAY